MIGCRHASAVSCARAGTSPGYLMAVMGGVGERRLVTRSEARGGEKGEGGGERKREEAKGGGREGHRRDGEKKKKERVGWGREERRERGRERERAGRKNEREIETKQEKREE